MATRKPFNPDLLPPPPPGDRPGGDAPLTVTQLTGLIKRALSRLPQNIAVVGEVSNFTRSPNGHLYFTLKDAGACVDCVMWASAATRLKFQLADGLALLAVGSVDVYEPRGRYQLYVTRLAPQGKGELELAFRQLHDKLSRLGWFDASRKRPIPRIPATVGVVTSQTGAAIRDVLQTLALRWPAARVIVADARVQGDGAPESVASAIRRMNRAAAALGGVDVLIVARGGGSLEDLWAFNTEIVARAILESAIPIVTGVGHEVDITIADLVADVRAATPTAAAQAVVPDRRDLAQHVRNQYARLAGRMAQRVRELASRLAACCRSETFRKPGAMLLARRQWVDELAGRLCAGHRELLHRARRRLAELAHRLESQHPRAVLARRWRRVESLASRLRWAQGKLSLAAERRLTALEARLRRHGPAVLFAQARLRVDAFRRQLASLDPRAVLRRGYSMTRLRDSDTLLTSADQARPGERLITELSAGAIESEVVSLTDKPASPRSSEPARPRTRKTQSRKTDDLPTLFGDGAPHGQE